MIREVLRWLHSIVFESISVPSYDIMRCFAFLRTSDDSLYSVISCINLIIITVISAYDELARILSLRFLPLRRWLFVVFVIGV